jgi:hypothetical protein
MEHTPEQRDIIRRMTETSKQLDEACLLHGRALSEVTDALTAASRAMAAAMDRSAEMHRLGLQHGELFRAYLATL